MEPFQKTIFFGPFIGEFGWELLFWHGWVRKMCLGKYRNFYKIAASFPGRRPFYPEVDLFLTHPADLIKGPISSRAYHTDNWRKGFYEGNGKLIVGETLEQDLLSYYRDKAGNNVEFISPTRWNVIPEIDLEFGTKCPADTTSDDGIITKRILFKDQLLDYLDPTEEGLKACKRIVDPDIPIIALFPRNRKIRRSDKNWPRKKYEELIVMLQDEYPNLLIGIFGEPGGAYFVDDIPNDCLDFINVDPAIRMDIQVAALKQTKLALGSMSGAILTSLACGAPSLTWGFPESEKRYHYENYMNSPFYYIPEINPSIKKVFLVIDNMINGSRIDFIFLSHFIIRCQHTLFKYIPSLITDKLKKKSREYIQG